MKEAMISQNEWVNLIRKQLTGKVLSAFLEEVIEMGTPYHVFRSTMLERMGATADKARRTIWLAKPSMEEGPEILLRRVLRAITMLKKKLATLEAAAQEIFQGFLHQHFTEETLMLLDSNRAETPQQQISTIKRLWDAKNFYARRRMWRHDPNTTPNTTQHTGWTKRERGYQKDNWTVGENQDQPPKESEPLSNRGGCGGRPSGRVWDGQRGSRSGGHPDNVNKSDKNKVTCFNCQKVGHYRSECPEGRAKF